MLVFLMSKIYVLIEAEFSQVLTSFFLLHFDSVFYQILNFQNKF